MLKSGVWMKATNMKRKYIRNYFKKNEKKNKKKTRGIKQ